MVSEVRFLGWAEVEGGEAGDSGIHTEANFIPDGKPVVVEVGGGALQVHVRFRRTPVRVAVNLVLAARSVVVAPWDVEDLGNPTRIGNKNWHGSMRNEPGKVRNGR